MPPLSHADSFEDAASRGLEALLHEAAIARLDAVGWIRVTGDDRVRWLNGMVTNSIQALAPGEGCYSFALNAQGRIQGDLIAWMLEDSILLESSHAGTLATWLDHYIIMDDVELTVLSLSAAQRASLNLPPDPPANLNARKGLLVAGPNAAAALGDLLGGIAIPEPLRFVSTRWQSATLDVFHAPSSLVSHFEIWCDHSETLDKLAALLGDRLPQATGQDLEHLRLLEGAPLYGVDIRDKELPQETAQTRALHFAKGCYLGQEIVERIHSRGAVHRTFSGFVLDGDLPVSGTHLFTADNSERPVGEITSASRIEFAGPARILGLGYIRRDVLERKAPLVYAGGAATASSLPFPSSERNEPNLAKSASEAEAAPATEQS